MVYEQEIELIEQLTNRSFDYTKDNFVIKEYIDYITKKFVGRLRKKKSLQFFNILKSTSRIDEKKQLFIKENRIFLNPFFECDFLKKDDMIKNNNNRMDVEEGETEFYLTRQVTKDILRFIKQYEELEMTKQKSEQPTKEKYIDTMSIEEHNDDYVSEENKYQMEEDDDYIIPKHTYSFKSLIKNLQINKNLKHLFNYSILGREQPSYDNNIKRAMIRINNFIGEVPLDIDYELECQSCGKVHYFNKYQLSTKFVCGCSENLGKPQANKSLIPSKQIKLYEYDIAYFDEKEKTWVDQMRSMYSLIELENIHEDVEMVYMTFKLEYTSTEGVWIIITRNEKMDNLRLEENIITEFPEDIYCAEHITNCMINYYRKHHSLKITTQNKILNVIGVLGSLFLHYFNIKMSILYAGDSGKGKSFMSEAFIPLLHHKRTTVSGGNITKSKYIGGKPEITSGFNSRFQKGVVGTQTLVVVEEFLPMLIQYMISPKDRGTNIFNMEKEINGETVNATSHGTKQYQLTAMRNFLGNLKDGEAYIQYKKQLYNEYKILGGEELIDGIPLYRAIEWYKKELGNDILAQAHYNIRSGNMLKRPTTSHGVTWDFHNNHYVICLPEAEMSRFHFTIFLEALPDEKETDLKDYDKQLEGCLNYSVDPNNLHIRQMLEELDTIFERINLKHMVGKSVDKYRDLIGQIEDYVKNEFLKKRNNFLFSAENINTHILQKIMIIAKGFILLDKMAKKSELKLTEKDKYFFEQYMRYNNNSMGIRELAMELTPYVNDGYDFVEGKIIDTNIDIKTAEEIKEKEKTYEYNEDEFETKLD